jgi:hypothetical protein
MNTPDGTYVVANAPYTNVWMRHDTPLWFVLKVYDGKVDIVLASPNEQDAREYAAVMNINWYCNNNARFASATMGE